MDQASTLLKEISKKSSSLYQIIQNIKEKSELYDDTCKKWEKTCLEIPDQVNNNLIKIAVTGAIKSGKSTFVNSIFKTDFLKRGAGVLTSVVTKIRMQKKLRAKLLIKSWDEINLEIEEGLLSFDDHYIGENKHFDIRRAQDRKYLEKIYGKFLNRKSFKDNQAISEIILFNNVLKNYEFCKNVVESGEKILELENDRFEEHLVFTSDPSKAFFIKDALLEVNFGNFDKDIEIADCQGIDSTDIGQLSKVLEYIESSNMIIYLISSRTGLREADMKFLSIIDKMGISDNVVFIINCDLGEHESLNDLKAVVKKTKQDLLFFEQDFNFYSFSSLYNLFNQNKPQLIKKDKEQIKVWENDKEIIKHSEDMTEKFFNDFDNWINKDRVRLTFTNPRQRLFMIARGLQKKIELFSDILSCDEVTVNETIQGLKKMQLGVVKVQTLVEKSMYSIEQDLKKEIYKHIDHHLKVGSDSIIDNLVHFINDYEVGVKKFEEKILASGFPKVLFFVLQDFKKEFDYFLVEKINPVLVKFIKDQEEALESRAIALYESFKVDLINLYKKLGKLPHELFESSTDIHNLTDLQVMKQRINIKPPVVELTTQYNARIKISSFTGFGFYSLLLVLFKKAKKELKQVRILVLKKVSLRFKKEALRAIKFQVDTYKQKLKKEYFDILIKALSEEINAILIDQFQIHSIEIENIESAIKKEKSEQDKQKEFLLLISKDIEKILQKA